MGKNRKKLGRLSAKQQINAKQTANKLQEKLKVERIQKQIQSDLSPKFTEMKTGARISRFGRPQKETIQDVNSIPTEISKFIPKNSPKRLKPKDFDYEQETSENEGEDCESQISEGLDGDKTSSGKENIPLDASRLDDGCSNTDPTLEVNETEKNSLKPMNDESVSNSVINIQVENENNNKVDVKKMNLDLDFIKVNEVKEATSKQADPIEQLLSIPSEETSSSDKNMLLNKISETSEAEVEKESSARVINFNFDDSITDKRESMGNHSDTTSDTDSALGSSSSHKEIKEENFCPGDILWGSFSRVSWYPCMVYPDEDGNIINAHIKSKQIHVKYFNWNGFTAHLPIKNVFELKSIDDFWQQIVELKIKKSKVKQFAKSCYKAIEEANYFKKIPVDERIKVFDETLKEQLDKKSRLPPSKKKSLQGESPSTIVKPADRKSVDSALEQSVSPVPSSPKYEDSTMKEDPIEIYLQDSFNLRKSNRAVKKRKFEGFVDGESKASTSGASIEQKAKQPKIAAEETLEDRFVVDLKQLRLKFKNFSKKRACMECLEQTNEPIFKCVGKGSIKCSRWCHQNCSGHFEKKREEIRHVAGDSEEIIQTQAMITTVTCKDCNDQVKNCFVCHTNVDIEDEEKTQHCLIQDCRLTYHKNCLEVWPQNKISKGNNTNKNKKNNCCPQHTCHSCFFKDIHMNGTLAKCVQCPASYHTELTCIPAGTVFLSQTQIVCPRHPSKKEIARNIKDNVKPLNVEMCNLCLSGGNLVCCDTCPNAFHYDCIGYVESDENFICQECREGRLPLYNSIVWARVGAYRWWPALVMHESSIPMKVLKTQKFKREFCVRFFGSYDFFYTTCERVLMYDGSNLSVKTGSSRLDSAFNLALDEAHEMSKLLEVADDTNAKPKPYTKIVVNRPIAPVKMKKIDEHTQGQCNCKPTDIDPCSRSSDCINVYINFECDGETCPAKEKCQNQKLRKREYVNVKVVKTQNRGFGVVTTTDIPEHTFIIEYVGELIDSNELTRRMKQKIKNNEKEFYFLTIEGDLYVDAEPAGNTARFINHSCEPNCDTRKLNVDGNTRIGIFSNQPIKAGTELTFDYQMEFVDNKKTACYCGSSKCSGLIGDKPIDPEKKVATGTKRKSKCRSLNVKIKLPKVERKRTLRDTTDPFETMMEKLNVSQSPEIEDITKEEASSNDPVNQDEGQTSEVNSTITDDPTPKDNDSQSQVKIASPFDFHVSGDSHFDQ